MRKKIIETQTEINFSIDCSSKRGGTRPGAGRKKMKSALKKQTKSFTLSPESVQALQDLQKFLGLPSQTSVIEFLALRAHREIIAKHS